MQGERAERRVQGIGYRVHAQKTVQVQVQGAGCRVGEQRGAGERRRPCCSVQPHDLPNEGPGSSLRASSAAGVIVSIACISRTERGA